MTALWLLFAVGMIAYAHKTARDHERATTNRPPPRVAPSNVRKMAR